MRASYILKSVHRRIFVALRRPELWRVHIHMFIYILFDLFYCNLLHDSVTMQASQTKIDKCIDAKEIPCLFEFIRLCQKQNFRLFSRPALFVPSFSRRFFARRPYKFRSVCRSLARRKTRWLRMRNAEQQHPPCRSDSRRKRERSRK